MVELTTLDKRKSCKDGSETIIGDDRTGLRGIIHIVDTVRLPIGVRRRTIRIITTRGLATVERIDGDWYRGAWNKRDVDRAIGERPGDPWAAEEEAERVVVVRAGEARVLLRTEHIAELQGITGRHEVELQNGRIVDHLPGKVFQIHITRPSKQAGSEIRDIAIGAELEVVRVTNNLTRAHDKASGQAKVRASRSRETPDLLVHRGHGHPVEGDVADGYTATQQNVLDELFRGQSPIHHQLAATSSGNERKDREE